MFDIKQLDNTYTDPQDQLLIALGVHPDQKDAQQKVTDALGSGTPKPDSAAATPSSSAPTRVNLRTGQRENQDASGNWQAVGTPDPSMALPPVAPIARPNAARPILLPEQRLAGDQAELDRLKSTGSGISQIKNPFLRGIARIGDVAGRALVPSIERDIPGTEGHHQQLVGQAQGNVANDLGVQQKQATLAQEQATTAHTKAETDALNDKPAAPPKPLFDQAGDLIGFQAGENLLGPNSPQLTPDMRDMMAATKGKKSAAGTPESQAMADLQTQVNPATGKNYTAYESFQKINQDKAENKPEQAKQVFQNTLQKAVSGAGGKVDPAIYSSLSKAAEFIKNSAAISDTERAGALAYLGSNNTPMSTGTNTVIRMESLNEGKMQKVYDAKTGEMGFQNSNDINAMNKSEPGRLIPAPDAEKFLSQAKFINDMRGSIGQVEKNIKLLDQGTWDHAKLAAALADPKTSTQAFLQSIPRGSLSTEQQQLITDLFNLRENAMAMRSVLGAGQGSEDVRRAILDTLPSAATPSSGFGQMQLDNMKKTLSRMEMGIPRNVRLINRGAEGAHSVEGNNPANQAKHPDEIKYPGFVADQ